MHIIIFEKAFVDPFLSGQDSKSVLLPKNIHSFVSLACY